jgi:hypothetical protein
MKLQNIKLIDGKLYHNNIEIDANTSIFNEIDTDYPQIKYIQIKGFKMDKFVSLQNLCELLYVKSLASLLNAQVVFDKMMLDKVDGFYQAYFYDLVNYIELPIEFFRANEIRFDATKLDYNDENRTFSRNGQLCVTREGSVTQYFRDFLACVEYDGPTVVINLDRSNLDHLNEFNVEVLEPPVFDPSYSEIDGMDVLLNEVVGSIGGAVNSLTNKYLYTASIMLGDLKEVELKQFDNRNNLIILNLARLQKEPKLIYENLINQSDNDKSVGLSEIGFNFKI